MKRRHSAINITSMEKLLSYKKIPKYVAIFPVMNLDTIGVNIEIFFPKNIQSGGADVLTKDHLKSF